jgi:hypothetical protein
MKKWSTRIAISMTSITSMNMALTIHQANLIPTGIGIVPYITPIGIGRICTTGTGIASNRRSRIRRSMLARTAAVVVQDFYHTALADPAMPAFPHHALEFLAQGLQFFKTDFYLLQLRARYGISGGTTCVRIVGQNQQFPDFVDAETQFPSVTDEFEPIYVFAAIKTVPAFSSLEGANKADFLVIAYGLHLSRRDHGEFTDGQSRHGFYLLNLWWL